MECPRCKAIVEVGTPACWMCHTPLAWEGKTAVLNGPPGSARFVRPDDDERRIARRKTNRLAGLLLLAVVILFVGLALVYRSVSDQENAVKRDSRGYYVETVDSVSMTFTEKPESKTFSSERGKVSARFVGDRTGKGPLTAALVVKLPEGSDPSLLSSPDFVAAMVQGISGNAGSTVTSSNGYDTGDLHFVEVEGSMPVAGVGSPFAMRIVASDSRMVFLMNAGGSSDSTAWKILKDEIRFK